MRKTETHRLAAVKSMFETRIRFVDVVIGMERHLRAFTLCGCFNNAAVPRRMKTLPRRHVRMARQTAACRAAANFVPY